MEPYGWKAKIVSNIGTLRIMGLWPNVLYQLDLYTAYSVTVMIIFLFGHIFAQTVNLYFIASDLHSLVATNYILLIDILGAVKVTYFAINVKVLKKQMLVFEESWFQPKNSNQKTIIDSQISFWKIVFKVMLSMAIGCNVFWAIYPLMDTSQNTREKPLPFLGWYPYDTKKSPFYEMTYIYQVLCTAYITTTTVAIDKVITGFYVCIACHLDLLSDNLKNLENSHRIQRNILQCVVYHKKILNFLVTTCKFQNWIMFWHLLISGVSIGLTMFLMTTVESMSNEFYSLLSFGLAITIEIFMYCWFASDVRVKSDKLAYSLFESQWVDLSEGAKKKVLFFTLNLSKPLQISALNIFSISLETYMKIMKTAWSYFALLHQVSSRS